MSVATTALFLKMSANVMGIRDVARGFLHQSSAMFICAFHSEATHVASEPLQLVFAHELHHFWYPPAASTEWVLMQEKSACTYLQLVHL